MDALADSDGSGDALRRRVTVVNERGLHARAAAKFVKIAESFKAEISVTRGETTVSGRSIMGLMMLAAAPGVEIEIAATGAEARTALAALVQLVSDRFGEE